MNENDDEMKSAAPVADAKSGSYFSTITRAQWSLVGLALIMAAGMLAYYGLHLGKFETSGLMFVGLPALLAILFTLLPRPKNPIWMAMKGTTIALCLSAIVLGEGVPCVIMAAPIFYLLAFIVAVVFERGRKSAEKNTVRVMVFVPLLVLSLEGTHEKFSFSRTYEVTAEKEIALAPEVFEERLARSFAFRAKQPAFLRLFTEPTGMSGSGLAVGDERKVRFRGPGSHGGVLRLRVTERKANQVKFKIVSDTTKIASWMTWRTAVVSWNKKSAGAHGAALRVRWTFTYERRLDPVWYFGPLQAHAVELGGLYLTDNLAY